MDPQPAFDPSVLPTGRLVTCRVRYLRRPRRGFWVLVVLLPALVAAGVAHLEIPRLERTLAHQARAALRAEGLDDVRVEADGRSVIARVPTGRAPRAVEKALAPVAGVAGVELVAVYASRAEARACRDLQGKVDRATRHQRIPFVGATDRLTPGGHSMLLSVARLLRACGLGTVTVGGHADSHTVDGSTLSLHRAWAMVAVLAHAGVDKKRLLARGYGDQFPVDEGDGPMAQARNQRGSLTVRNG